MIFKTDYVNLYWIIFIGFWVQSIAGFGSVLIILSLGTLFYNLSEVFPIVVLLDTIFCFFLLIRNYKTVDLDFLIYKISFPLVSGFLTGFFFLKKIIIYTDHLTKIFGILLFFLSIFEIIQILRKSNFFSKSKIYSQIWIFFAGIVHSLFAIGGPFLVYGLSRYNLDKYKFRSTLVFIWYIFNSFLGMNHSYSSKELATVMTLLLVMPFSFLAGKVIFQKISLNRFHFIIRILLFILSILILTK